MHGELEGIVVLLLDGTFDLRRADLPCRNVQDLRPFFGGKIKIQQQAGLVTFRIGQLHHAAAHRGRQLRLDMIIQQFHAVIARAGLLVLLAKP